MIVFPRAIKNRNEALTALPAHPKVKQIRLDEAICVCEGSNGGRIEF